jgi:hypothetical protein
MLAFEDGEQPGEDAEPHPPEDAEGDHHCHERSPGAAPVLSSAQLAGQVESTRPPICNRCNP